MKKLGVMLLAAAFAVPMFAQDTPKDNPPKTEKKKKVKKAKKTPPTAEEKAAPAK